MNNYEINVQRWLGIQNIQGLVTASSEVLTACSREEDFEVTIDLAAVEGIFATGLVTLTAIAKYIGLYPQCQRSYVTRPKSEDVHGYMTRMGLYRQIGLEAIYPYRERDPAGRFHELVEITDIETVNDTSNALADIVRRQNPSLSLHGVNSIRYALSELIENVFHHAQSPINAIVCAQAHPKQRSIELAIVDCGRGFRRSLDDNPQYRGRYATSSDAISLALEPSVTRNPEYNSGEGLYFTSELVKHNRGDMVICSEDGLYRIRKGVEEIEQMCYTGSIVTWPGTIAAIRLFLNNPMDMTSIYNQLAPPDNDFVILEENIPF